MKKQLSLIVIIIAVLLLSSTFILFSQEGRGGGRLVGTAKDKDGAPLENVKIILQAMSFNFKLETTSGKDGEWGFYGFGKDQFKVTASKEGYTPFEHILPLSGVNKNPVLDIVMAKIPPQAVKDSKVDNASKEAVKKGNTLYKEGKFAEALPYFKNFLDSNPDQYKMGINLGNCYLQLKQYEDAIKAFQAAIEGFKKENPNLKGNANVASLYANVGEAYSGMENLEEAAVNYRKSMEILPPTDAAVAYNVAEILFNGGKTDEAIEYYELAAKLKPEMAIYYSKLGYAYLNKGEIEAAISYFEKFVKMAPNDPQTPALQDLIKDLKQ
jgi:tetratricopeptide (TPR) repeat protein